MKLLVLIVATLLVVKAENPLEIKDKRGTSSKGSQTQNAIQDTTEKNHQNLINPSQLQLQYAIPIQYISTPQMKPIAIIPASSHGGLTQGYPQGQPIMLVIPQMSPQVQPLPYQSIVPQNANYNQAAQTLLQYYQANPAAKYQLLHNPYSQFSHQSTQMQPIYYSHPPTGVKSPASLDYIPYTSTGNSQSSSSSSPYTHQSYISQLMAPHVNANIHSYASPNAYSSTNSYVSPNSNSYVSPNPSPSSYHVSPNVSPNSNDNLNTNEYYPAQPGEKLQSAASSGSAYLAPNYYRTPYRLRY